MNSDSYLPEALDQIRSRLDAITVCIETLASVVAAAAVVQQLYEFGKQTGDDARNVLLHAVPTTPKAR